PARPRTALDISRDSAAGIDFRARAGQPLIGWHDPESAFEAWKACSKGRPCDYSGLSYDKLRRDHGIQGPCNAEHPAGAERLYTDLRFNTDPQVFENYGHDLLTGAVTTETEYRASNPAGRAILKAADYQPPHEEPTDAYPLRYSTGRTLSTSTPAPRPPAPASCSRSRPTPGSSCRRPTPTGWESAGGTRSGSGPHRAESGDGAALP